MRLENNLTIIPTQGTRDDYLAQLSWNDTNIVFNQDEEGGVVFNVMLAVAAIFVVAVNCWVVYFMSGKTRTLVENMVLLDCVANMGGLLTFFFHYPKLVWANDDWCRFTLLVSSYFTILNRVIPITIAIYRYLLVCQAEKTILFGKTKLTRLLTVSYTHLTLPTKA